MHPCKYQASLRIRVWDPNINLSEVSDRLGLIPQRIWAIGELRTDPKGNSLPGTYDNSYCFFELTQQQDEDLPSMLTRISQYLMPHKNLFQHIKEAGGSIEFFIGWFSVGNTGEIFDSLLLRRLGELGIDLALDVYGENSPVAD